MPDQVERFSVRLSEPHSGARIVLKTSPDGAMVRWIDREIMAFIREHGPLRQLADQLESQSKGAA